MKNLKKKLFLFVVVLAAAAILVSGCSEDALKDRVPGVKANVGMTLAEDINENVGEIETEQELESFAFGEELVNEVEAQLKNASGDSATSDFNSDIPIPEGTTVELKDETVTISLTSDNLSNAVKNVKFGAGNLVIDFDDGNEDNITVDELTVTNGDFNKTSNDGSLI